MNLRKESLQIIWPLSLRLMAKAPLAKLILCCLPYSQTGYAQKDTIEISKLVENLKQKNQDQFNFQESYFNKALQDLKGSGDQNIVELGFIEWLCNQKKFDDANKRLQKILKTDLGPREKEIALYLMAKNINVLVKWEDFLSYSEKFFQSNPKIFYPNIIYPQLFQTYVQMRQTQKALNFYLKEYTRIERTHFPVVLEDTKVSLVKLAEKDSSSSESTTLLKTFAQNFPLTPSSREAARVLKIKDMTKIFPEISQREKQAKRIFQFFGPTADARMLAFNILKFDEKHVLDQLEFSVSVRDYEMAQKIIENIQNKKLEYSNSETDRFLFFYARTMSSLQKTDLAAEAYKRIFEEFPQSKHVKQARTRYAKALHLIRKYQEAGNEFQNLASQKGFGNVIDFRYHAFWSFYLAKNWASAEKSAQILLNNRKTSVEMKNSLRYWLARIQEKKGNKIAAIPLYKNLTRNRDLSLYDLFAQWRLTSLDSNFSRVTLKANATSSILSRETTRDGDESLPPPFARAFQYWDVGLLIFAKDEIRSNWVEIRKTKNLENLMLLCYDLRMYDLSERLPLKTSLTSRVRFPLPYENVLKEVEKSVGANSSLVSAIMRAESRLDPMALSWVGARGLMQLIPQTANKIAETHAWPAFRLEDLSTPEINIAMGSWYLAKLMKHYQNNLVLAVAAYNAGPVAVDRWISQRPDLQIDEFAEEIPFAETKTYVGRVLSNLDRYEDIHHSTSLKLSNYVAKGALPSISDDWDPF